MNICRTTGTFIIVVVALAWPAAALGQTGGSGGNTRGCCTFGLFAGVTDRERADSELTVGGEIELDLQGPWATGAILEHTSDAYIISDATLLLGAVHYRPPGSPRLKFTGGAGMEFNDFNDDVRLRAGVGYDVIQGPMTLTPRLAVDFGNGSEHLVLGASFYF